MHLPRYYSVSDHPDLSDVGDLSWDEGDLPHQEIKVAAIFYGNLGLMYLGVDVDVSVHTI